MNSNNATQSTQQGNEPDEVAPFGRYAGSTTDRIAWKVCGWHAHYKLPGKALWENTWQTFSRPVRQNGGEYATSHISACKLWRAYYRNAEQTA